MEENFKNLVFEQGFVTLFKRMQAILDCGTMRRLLSPQVIDAKITDMQSVETIIKKKWPVFNIKDIEINLKSQTVSFKIWGGPYWIPKDYRSYIIFQNDWSPVETERCNYQRTTEEQYAEKNLLPISEFIGNGIEATIV